MYSSESSKKSDPAVQRGTARGITPFLETYPSDKNVHDFGVRAYLSLPDPESYLEDPMHAT